MRTSALRVVCAMTKKGVMEIELLPIFRIKPTCLATPGILYKPRQMLILNQKR